MSAAAIREKHAALREAGARLRQRRAIERIELLGKVLELWRDPGSLPREVLAKELPAAAGFSEPVVREGMQRALAGWSRDALHALVQDELGGVAALEPSGERAEKGFDTTALVLAGSLPTPTLAAILAPLCLGSAVLVKPASRDPLTPRLVARSLAMLDAELGDCVALAPFARDDDEARRAFLAADCVVAVGSDASVAEIAAQAQREERCRRFVGHGHRLSVAALGPGSERAAAMAALALDVALWDQQGCLSPVALYVVGPSAPVAEALAAALAELEARLPRGRLDPQAAALLAHERADAELRAAAGHGVTLHACASFTVVGEADATPRLAPLGRFLRIHPVADEAALFAALQPLASHLAGIGLAGFGSEQDALAERLSTLGASRVCDFGTLQAPPLSWSHDGRGVLRPLVVDR